MTAPDSRIRDQLLAAGHAHQREGRAAEAAACYRAILGEIPGDAGALAGMGTLALQAGNATAAVPLLEAAARAAHDDTVTRYNLGMAYVLARRFEAARDAFGRVLERDPSHGPARSSLGNVHRFLGDPAAAHAAYAAAIALPDLDAVLFSQALVGLHSDPALHPDEGFAWHRAWARRFASPVPPRPAPSARRDPARPGRELRVGLVSPGFHGAIVGTFLRGVLPTLAQEVSLHLYDASAGPRGPRAELASAGGTWHAVGALDDDALAARIRADGIDVLVDLAGHAPGHRLRVFARRPAPVQLTWLDYFDTTGLETIDGIVTDPVTTPESLVAGGAQQFTETPLRMPHARLAYALPAFAPQVAPLPALAAGRVTFGCFGRADKIVAPVLDAWARILAAVPEARLLLKGPAYDVEAVKRRIADGLVARGVDARRLAFEGPSPHAELLAAYARVDIALDTFPYNGGATTCDALAMGVPVVTVAGRSMIARQGASLLAAAGCAPWVGDDVGAYVAIAGTLAGDLPALAATRAGLRPQLVASPLGDGPAFARDFARLVRDAWRRFARRDARLDDPALAHAR